jgi:hypothetical protein
VVPVESSRLLSTTFRLYLRFSTNKSRTSKNKNAAPKTSLIGVTL